MRLVFVYYLCVWCVWNGVCVVSMICLHVVCVCLWNGVFVWNVLDVVCKCVVWYICGV